MTKDARRAPRHARMAAGASSVTSPWILGVGLAFLAVAALIWAWIQSSGVKPLVELEPALEAQSQSKQTTQSPGGSQSATAPEPLEFTISAGGDMLIHMPVADSAWTGQTWDFTPQMAQVQPYLEGSDIALCNMETAFVPEDQAPAGYPLFGTPRALADSMAAVGWTGCSTSSNHSLDQGYSGVVNTIDFLEAAGLGHAGTARSQKEADSAQFYEITNGEETIQVAHLAAAHNTNGIPIPEAQPWAINMMDVQKLEADAERAREGGADLVLVTYHCCEAEYDTAVEQEQIDVAQELAASGLVDAVISHHAHVPRTIDLLEGGPGGNGMWVAYGLGNFISNQSVAATGSAESSTGVMVFFSGQAAEGEPTRITDAHWLAVTTDIPSGHVVRPLSSAGAEGAQLSGEELADRYARTAAIFEGSPATELTEVPSKGKNVTTVISHAR